MKTIICFQISILIAFNANAFLETLPTGVPAMTQDKDLCFLPGEKEIIKAAIPRVTVPGCSKKMIKPVVEILAIGPYRPGNYRTYDCRYVRTDSKHRSQAVDAVAELVGLSNKLALSPSDAQTETCILNTLNLFASSNAYSRIHNSSTLQAHHVRSWDLGGISAVYNKHSGLRDEGSKSIAIEAWLRSQGYEILNFANRYSATNNLGYWKGFTLTSLGFATQNTAFVSKGESIFNQALGHIKTDGEATEKGYLQAELDRGPKAQHYHEYSIQPLFGMIAISKAYRCNFLDSNDKMNRLKMLVRKTIQGQQDPTVFQEKTGYVQDSPKAVEGLFYLLGDDSNARTFINYVSNNLTGIFNMSLIARAPVNKNQLGGKTDSFPAPGSQSNRSSSLTNYCR